MSTEICTNMEIYHTHFCWAKQTLPKIEIRFTYIRFRVRFRNIRKSWFYSRFFWLNKALYDVFRYRCELQDSEFRTQQYEIPDYDTKEFGLANPCTMNFYIRVDYTHGVRNFVPLSTEFRFMVQKGENFRNVHTFWFFYKWLNKPVYDEFPNFCGLQHSRSTEFRTRKPIRWPFSWST